MNTCLISAVLRQSLVSRMFGGACAALLAVHSASAAEDPAKVVETSVGKEFTIELESNRTTGYGWQLQKPLDESLVKAVKNEYLTTPRPAGEVPMAGAGGKEVWTFKAVRAGKTAIDFKYVRPWEADKPPAKTASFRVVIKGAAAAGTPAPDNAPIIKEGAEVVLKGRLQGGMMGIGGESTGWQLTYQTKSGTHAIEVDCSALKAGKIPEGAVRVAGKVFKKAYVERGPTLILKATKIEKQP
jgi:predicted secreted protein